MIIHGAHPGDDDYEYGFDSEVDGVITCVGTYQRHVRELVIAFAHKNMYVLRNNPPCGTIRL